MRRTHAADTADEHFADDHRAIEERCSRILGLLDERSPDVVASLVIELDEALNAHLDEEELGLLPGLFRDRLREARLLVEEHRYIRGRMAALRADAEIGALRRDETHAFFDELRAHTAHEEAIFLAASGDWSAPRAARPGAPAAERETTRPPKRSVNA